MTCEACEGTGVLVAQGYGFAELPEDWLPVQRCDECGRFDGDEQAACSTVLSGVAAEFRYFTAPDNSEGDPLPGDWAIRMVPT